MTKNGQTLLLLSTLLITPPAWCGSVLLQDGSKVEIDNTTRRATQGGAPLWDGVHQRQDGSVMIIRDGVVISGSDSAPQASERTPPKVDNSTQAQISPCVQLAIRSCGFNGACKGSQACLMAKQLVNMELQEQAQGLNSVGPGTLEQCHQALTSNSYFTACENNSTQPTPCSQLTAHVCGFNNQCAEREACQVARQLLTMEQNERAYNRLSERFTASAKQCLEAIKQKDFFNQCPAASR
ncbi:MAG: hypothetical protein MI754_10995 [Chromatiales bacterium]|nr:hypothetical protein [Chromatiales bacterium]